LGSTGSIGTAVVNELTSTGRPLRALVRNPTRAGKVFANPEKVEFVEGSVEDPQTLQKAFEGVESFYNCINPPYQQWSRLPEVHGRIIDAARRVKARMAFPGNVYIYGHTQTDKVREDHPRNPCSRKGRIRLALEESFMRNSREGEVPCVIVRKSLISLYTHHGLELETGEGGKHVGQLRLSPVGVLCVQCGYHRIALGSITNIQRE